MRDLLDRLLDIFTLLFTRVDDVFGPLNAWLEARGTTLPELLGFTTGVLNVWLTVRERLWAWPIGIVNALFYLVVFARAGLYSDTGLQLVYLALSVYGWWHWARGGPHASTLTITRVPRAEAVRVLSGALMAWLMLWQLTQRLPGARLALFDAALVAGSLAAQWLMTRKYVECWWLWLIVNTGYVAVFLARGLRLTAVLYAIYWGLAALGALRWHRTWRSAPASA
ncbi:MAG: nicotinamide riboside transporter PnuC [Gemmatimonadaceae bacterium]|nr:nicotinamide riboside transporter PnuC [Gemmatimonadaceae bacterium]